MGARSIIERGRASVLALALPLLIVAGSAAAQDREFGGEIELVDPTTFRVCADPNNMPFANEAEEGFEQEVARLLAEKLGRQSVSYTYFPQATGFVRMTLGSNLCDIIMSYPQGDELVQNTNAYYRTAYALVVPADGDLANVTKLEDEPLKGKRIGIVAGTPPATYLAKAGLIGKAKPYQLMVDTRIDNSAKAMIDDLDAGTIDAAVLWGPLAGWYAKQSDKDYTVIPLVNEGAGPAMVYRITMGVRSADQQWKRQLNVAIRDNQEAINDILLSYGVPLLTEGDEPIEPSGSKGDTAMHGSQPSEAGSSSSGSKTN
ncbi:quinoprotein dehydrogenase-associated putative ABC transporter substrate-binding protein [Fulvimarina endophytica]|uniref:Quinoprotein dehydrogenase-associated putative ABC transporter substrate-binding protein n=1 Tax=Fulvimarina endophytica TaxID=2293836 RepID=A0A371X0E0_9HYPH|nr:quinoprotein dehydrogenase-associated putative ABC transporter substrate-binding protein [Fulvimarina endophytica]